VCSDSYVHARCFVVNRLHVSAFIAVENQRSDERRHNHYVNFFVCICILYSTLLFIQYKIPGT
jgi:hypothetical protein